jgi:VanZ family protein
VLFATMDRTDQFKNSEPTKVSDDTCNRKRTAMRILQGLAILMGAVLLIVTIVPAADRPLTGLQHDVEHFAAFALVGILFAASFEIGTTRMLLAGAGYTLMLECLQIPLPTRHARLEDFIVDAIAICCGIVLVRLSRNYMLRVQS